MDEIREGSIHHTALKFTEDIKQMKIYNNLYKTVQKLTCSPDVKNDDMKNTLEQAMKKHGLETEIRNIVFHLIRNSIKSEVKFSMQTNDPLNYLRRAGIQWERRVRKSLNTMCSELKTTLQGQLRKEQEKEELSNKWTELSNFQVDLSNYRPVYAPKDLLEVLVSLKGPAGANKDDGCSNDDVIPRWEFSHIALPVRNLQELRTVFSEILRNEMTLNDWSATCERILSTRHAPLCQQILKKGLTPILLRGKIWSIVLGSELEDHHNEYWEELKVNVLNTDSIVDKLVFKDVQLTATNDDQYFVFEDVIYQVMLCFSRDSEIADMIKTDWLNTSKLKQYETPQNNIVPFHGICMFAAPFCYLYDSPIALYYTFRAFYVRYCHRLTTINTHNQGIVSLCLLFEKLLQTHEPSLWSHFRELQIQPIRVVFKWLMRAFSGHLHPQELLILWDLILGYDSLEILSLLAIIILSFRKESLMQVSTIEQIEAVLADLSSIKVLPLVQLALSRD
ncbi:hypothetical protein PVAND_005715 [Polypedilum vanderplanki]|uniref:Rab-GAP TBC domain-containing protein n=1 Tax=Polypedilum vanderplanki TaxID=319348 RepID=A0A9J6C1V3_POLVA|nr:hypothetical protein PVAND_005715 [Polypedilum vanderplanki]